MRVVVLDAGSEGREALVASLDEAGHRPVVVGSLLGLRRLARRSQVDFLLIDRLLPDGDGLDALDLLADLGQPVPSIGISAGSTPSERAEGLRRGLDDFVCSQMDHEELLARILAVSRRARVGPDLEVGPVRIDLRTHTVEVKGARVDLTAREFSLLHALARSAPRVRSRSELLDEVWGVRSEPGSNLVDVYVRYLRGKVGPRLIRTVRGVGYALDPRSAPRLRSTA